VADESPYDPCFFAAHESLARASARRVLPIVAQATPIKSVVDVGCGTGEWLAVARELGAEEVIGLDGGWVPRDELAIAPAAFRATDLALPVELDRRFDLVLSLEVAEHLDPARADGFVGDLCRLGPVVLFSAAVPGQTGTDHRNEQWPQYWHRRFAAQGFVGLDVVRRALWDDEDVAPWYAQNAFVFVHRRHLERLTRLRDLAARARSLPLAVVHPRLLAILSPARHPADPEPWR
jgi:SAM-dependent methyltransferase